MHEAGRPLAKSQTTVELAERSPQAVPVSVNEERRTLTSLHAIRSCGSVEDYRPIPRVALRSVRQANQPPWLGLGEFRLLPTPGLIETKGSKAGTMSRKTATPTEISEALALREAGYTALSISQRLGISVRSLQRHFADHGSKKGSIKKDVLDAARADLLKRVTSDDAVREEAARLINDDLAHARHLREIMIDATEQLQATSLKEAVLVMRAAAAYSTAIKNTSDVLRQTLRIDRAIEDGGTELPELIIRELTDAEIKEMREEMPENKLQTA